MSKPKITFLVGARLGQLNQFTEALQEQMTTIQASTAQEAIDEAKKRAPTLVIIDQMVQDETGLDIARRLLQTNAFINAVILSDMDDDQFHDKSEGLGILAKLPRMPNAEDAEKILVLLDQVAVDLTP